LKLPILLLTFLITSEAFGTRLSTNDQKEMLEFLGSPSLPKEGLNFCERVEYFKTLALETGKANVRKLPETDSGKNEIMYENLARALEVLQFKFVRKYEDLVKNKIQKNNDFLFSNNVQIDEKTLNKDLPSDAELWASFLISFERCTSINCKSTTLGLLRLNNNFKKATLLISKDMELTTT
jgi:hypothetical protein